MKPSVLFFCILMFFNGCANSNSQDLKPQESPIPLGDPFILKVDTNYYLYGTNAANGIVVYQSKDLSTWSGPCGATANLALHKNDVWGEKWFWAPEIYQIDELFYMFYSAEEHIAVATSESPLGPFVQKYKEPLLQTKAIDTHLFIDDDGRKYLYYVAFTNGNVIWMCEMTDDCLHVQENSIKECFGCSQPWEFSTKSPVAIVNEGPYVLKHNDLYYMVYSANHFENPDYGIGYAIASKPTGPWEKYKGNPIIASGENLKGTGHCAFFMDHSNNLNVVYHSHHSNKEVQPRLVHINQCKFVPDPDGGPDILTIIEPVLTPVLSE